MGQRSCNSLDDKQAAKSCASQRVRDACNAHRDGFTEQSLSAVSTALLQ